MSDYGSTDEIKRKIREGMYHTFVKESTDELRKYFVMISWSGRMWTSWASST